MFIHIIELMPYDTDISTHLSVAWGVVDNTSTALLSDVRVTNNDEGLGSLGKVVEQGDIFLAEELGTLECADDSVSLVDVLVQSTLDSSQTGGQCDELARGLGRAGDLSLEQRVLELWFTHNDKLLGSVHGVVVHARNE